MTDLKKAAEMALDALESAANNEGNFHDYKYAAEALRQALAQPDLSIEANRVAYDVAMHYANKTKDKNT